MFFSRKKMDAAMAEVAAQIFRDAEEFQEKINAAEKLADMGERYLALTEIGSRMQSYRDAVGAKSSILKNAEWYLIGGAVAGASLMGAGPAVPVALYLYFCGAGAAVTFGSFGAGAWLSAKEENYRKGVQDSLDAAFTGLSQKVAGQKESIIKNELPALAASPHFDALYDRFPVVKEAFIKASARESVAPSIARLDKPSYPRKP